MWLILVGKYLVKVLSIWIIPSTIDKSENELSDFAGILSDATSDGPSPDGNEVQLYGLLGDPCIDDRDCFLDHSVCKYAISSKRCLCEDGFVPTSNNVSCEQGIELSQNKFSLNL